MKKMNNKNNERRNKKMEMVNMKKMNNDGRNDGRNGSSNNSNSRNKENQFFNKRAGAAIDKIFSRMEVINKMQVILGLDDKNEIQAEFQLESLQSSEVIRACNVKKMVISDGQSAIFGMATTDVMSVRLRKEVIKSETALKKVFSLLVKDGLNIVYNVKTGLPVVLTREPKIKNENYIGFSYKLLGATASGLKNGTIETAIVATFKPNGIKVAEDRRFNLLKYTLQGCFEDNFVSNNEIIKMKREDGFKQISRILLGQPASLELGVIRNYAVVEALDKGSIVEGVAIADSQDGASNVSSSFIAKAVKLREKEVVGIILQLRGASLKASSVVARRGDMMAKLYAYQARNNGFAPEDVIVLDGKQYKGSKITGEILKALSRKIEFLGDFNAVKLKGGNNCKRLVALKKGHMSKTKLNTVVNMLMQHIDNEKSERIIEHFIKKEMFNKFGSLGIKLKEKEDGVDIAFSSKAERNNEGQFLQYILKSCPDFRGIAPQSLKSGLGNLVQSVRNLINFLNPMVDSFYTVVQPDIAVLFNCKILKSGELYCNNIDSDRIIGVRHPVSSILAVTKFRKINYETVKERVDATTLTKVQKDCVLNFYRYSKDFAIIEVSEDLKERHDGMDFDIDSMQFIAEESVVDAIWDIDDSIYITIDRSQEETSGNIKTESEMQISDFKKGGDVLTNPPAKEASSMKIGDCPIKLASKITKKEDPRVKMDFEGMGQLIFDYYKNPVDPIGMIATSYYNNQMLYNYLCTASEEMKEKVALILATEYQCHGNDKYRSPIKEEISSEGHKIYALTKEKCCKILYNFANCDGSKESCMTFLRDCCYSNRYPAESSIDSAKKGFMIINYFDHGFLIKSLGSDKNSKIVTTADDAAFESIVEKINDAFGVSYSKTNSLNIKLLDMDDDTVHIDKMGKKELILAVEKNKAARQSNSKPVAIGIEDSFYCLKKKLVNYFNFLVVLTTKMFEDELNSDSSKAKREEVIKEGQAIAAERTIDIKKSMGAIASLAISTDITISSSCTFEEKNSILYKKNEGLNTLKNSAALFFDGCSNYEIGAIVTSYFALKYDEAKAKKEKLNSLNSNILKIFEEQILVYLSAKGYDMRRVEAINSVQEKDSCKIISFKKTNIKELVFENGVAETSDYTVLAENKKLACHGEIEYINGKPFIVFEKEYNEQDATKGIFLAVNNKDVTAVTGKKKNFNLFSNIKFNKKISRNGRNEYSVISGEISGATYKLASIFTTSAVAELLATTDCSFEIFYGKDDTMFVYANSEKLAEELLDILSYRESGSDSSDSKSEEKFEFEMDEESIAAMFFSSPEFPSVDGEDEAAMDSEPSSEEEGAGTADSSEFPAVE